VVDVALVTVGYYQEPSFCEGETFSLMNGSSPGAGRDVLLEYRTYGGLKLMTLS